MKKQLLFSAITAGLICSVNVQAAEDLSTMFSEGKTSGQVRMFYVDREYQGSSGTNNQRNSMAVGGHLKFETADYNGLNFATAVYTTNDINLFDYSDNASEDSLKKDPTLLGPDGSYSILGEAYVGYKRGNTSFKYGRMSFDSAMMGGDDARMLKNLFQGYVLTNKDITNVNIQLAHITKFAQGTFGNVYGAGGILGATSGYSAHDATSQVGSFKNMGEYAVGKNTNGVTSLMATYKNGNFKAKIGDDYAHDLYNTIYADASISWTCLFSDKVKPFFAAQAIKQNSVGDKLMKDSGLGGNGEIDSSYWAGKFGAKAGGFTGYVAYSTTGKNSATDSSYKNAIITQFGGMPAFTQGMVTRHQFLAGTDTTKFGASYSFKEMGTNASLAGYYASFDMDANSGYGGTRTATEAGFDAIYYPASVKNLQLRFRGNFPRDFAGSDATTTTGWNEYRLIANYNF
ncbi:OprD family outer membrane porin [Candidatus Sulfurimonas baltica]|uniref:Outer membrane porin, OprD family n=1 Tax=Candidatus Sulfurimonas baltica TaxID=2740404 RepID=A0A7S7RNM9_9BACT|nr:OprD family outer membrane porin [Candidatus Sulfurimonas baltica]QOY52721.1 outer membrane porin, OprD family [Candidatus Sulfurimonas baltica]